MLGAIQGGAVLLLLSVFFAHMLAPAVAALRRRVRIGPRQRPISRPIAILLLYLAVFVPGALVWRGAQDDAVHWVRVTAPAAVERLFSGGNFEPFERLIARAPISAAPGAAWSSGSSAPSVTSSARSASRSTS